MERRSHEAKRAPHAVNLNDIDDASRQVHGDDFLVESTEERKVDIEVLTINILNEISWERAKARSWAGDAGNLSQDKGQDREASIVLETNTQDVGH